MRTRRNALALIYFYTQLNEIFMSLPEIIEASDLWTKVQPTRFVLLTTTADDGSLESRPMAIQRIDEPGTVRFFGSLASRLVQALSKRSQVNIGVANPDDDFYVPIVGKAQLSHDRPLIRALWTPLTKAWLPGGVDDEDLVVMEVIASPQRRWNGTESGEVRL